MANFQSSPVSSYMSRPILGVQAKASALEADRLLDEHDVSALGVFDDDRLVGVISRTDLLDAASGELGETFSVPDEPVRRHMTPDPVMVGADTPLRVVAKRMLDERIHRVFVEEGGEPVGVCSTRDLMRAVYDARVTQPSIEIATKGVVKVKADDSLSLAVSRLDVSNKHGLVVVADGWPVGIFAQVDALAARARDPRTPVEEVMSLMVLALPPTIPLYVAAGQALALGARRILLVDEHQLQGVVSTFDFARVVR